MRMINAFTVHALNTFVLTFLTIAMLCCMKNLNLPGWCIFKIKMITMLYMCNINPFCKFSIYDQYYSSKC